MAGGCCLVIFLLLLIVGLVENNLNASPEDVLCFSFDSQCRLCIQEPTCQWCSEMIAMNASQHHCFSTGTDLSKVCSEVENLQNSDITFLKNVPLTEVRKKKINHTKIVQLKPQHIKLALRKGFPKNITVSFRQVKDYPLDLYYLMDLSKSMLTSKLTLGELGQNLASTMRKLTSQFKIGFGSFVDKVMLPFVNTHKTALASPCPDIACATPFSFQNNLKLTEDDAEFVRQVKAAQISTNLDSPEGGFDALMQAMVCEEQIGWRKDVRKIIILSTDAGFHTAGDGKLAGVIMPNDGKCHTNNDGFYDKYSEYDYPSIGQINSVAQEKGINIIFAVKGAYSRGLYQKLSENIQDSAYGELVGDSSNIIDLVTKVYNSITGKVEISIRNPHKSPVAVRIFSNCGAPGADPRETNQCNNIKEGSTVDFQLEIKVSECPKDGEQSTQLVIGTLQESILIDVDLLCNCQCENENHKGYEANSPACGGKGTKQCDACLCQQDFYGERCQCNRNEVSTAADNDLSKCRPEGSNPTDSLCSGRGYCECETCICWKERHHGRFCHCDRGMCRQHINSNVECSGHGDCECSACFCNPGWGGQFCECRSHHFCLAKGDTEPCSGNGECECGKCECKISYTGKYCEECPSCGEGKCLTFRDCVQCDVWNGGPLAGDACRNCTDGKIPTLSSLEAQLREYARLCTFEEESTGCQFNFTYKYTDEGYEIFAQNNQKCPEKIDILAVSFGVIGGIVGIGLLTLIIWKIVTTVHDRREYLRFMKETQNAKWNAEENPLYKKATTTVANPAFSTK